MWSVDFFVELSHEELLSFPPLMKVRRRLLEASVDYFRDLAKKRPADLAFRRELAAMQSVITCLLLTDDAVRVELGLGPEQTRRVAAIARPVDAEAFCASDDPLEVDQADAGGPERAEPAARRREPGRDRQHASRHTDRVAAHIPARPKSRGRRGRR